MVILTNSEKKIALFLGASLLLGITLLFFRSAGWKTGPITVQSKSQLSVARNSRININAASDFSLTSLPGIGPALANRIIDYRKRNGPFVSAEDLKKVKGIGERKFERIRARIDTN